VSAPAGPVGVVFPMRPAPVAASPAAAPLVLVHATVAMRKTFGGAWAFPGLLLAGAFTPAVALAAAAFTLPSLELTGAAAPAASVAGGLLLPSLLLAGAFEPTVGVLAGALVLPSAEVAGSLAPTVGVLDGGLVLPSAQVAGAVSPSVPVGGALALPSGQQLAGSVSPAVTAAGALVLPSLTLAGTLAPSPIELAASALVLPSMQLAGTFTVAVSKVTAILLVRNGTITGAGYSSIPDAFANNPAVQTVDARRPAAATSELGLPILSFNGANVLSWPLAANNGQLTAMSAPGSVTGWCAWVKFTSVAAAFHYLYCAANGVGGLVNRRLRFGAALNTVMNMIHTVDGGGNIYGQTPGVLAPGAWLWIRYMWIAGGAAVGDKILVYVNGALQSLTWVGTGTIYSLPATTGNILLGSFNNDTVLANPGVFTGYMGPRLTNLDADLTAEEEAALWSCERPAPAYDPQIVSATATNFNNNTVNNPTAGPWTIPLPARAIGDRLILLTNRRVGGGSDFNCAGWTAIPGASPGSASADTRALYRDITAANVGDANAVVTSSAGYPPSQCLIWRLSGCDPSVAPTGNGTTQNTVGVGTLNPAALTAPSTGRNLWLTYIGIGGQQSTDGLSPVVTVWPATYGNTGWSSTNVGFAGNGVGQAWGSKVAVAGSDDPSSWTYHAGITQSRAFAITIAVRGVQF
jgi:hypothetical protein